MTAQRLSDSRVYVETEDRYRSFCNEAALRQPQGKGMAGGALEAS
jgi:hypothetical protein